MKSTIVENRVGRTAGGRAVSYQLKAVKCGSARCTKCPHGSYWYAFWKSGGRTRSRYVGRVFRELVDAELGKAPTAATEIPVLSNPDDELVDVETDKTPRSPWTPRRGLEVGCRVWWEARACVVSVIALRGQKAFVSTRGWKKPKWVRIEQLERA